MSPSQNATLAGSVDHGVVLILGATSAMAEHTAREHARRGDQLILVARSANKLEAIKADLETRGTDEVITVVADLADANDHAQMLQAWLGGRKLYRAYIFFGVLGQQDAAQEQLDLAAALMQVNYNAPALWSLTIANTLEKQQAGCLVVASSVAGDRGRMSNHIYGSAKAGLSTLVQGIDHRLSKAGARAVAIRYGFVISPMTEGMRRSGPLWTSAKKAGQLAVSAGDKKRSLIYAPSFWRGIMGVIRSVPTSIFNRTKL
ncbi:MAG: SDR family NAD(P)-dependent oxidoreductase [Parvularcula sp.]|jgi:short-subunit dehydrogenase|nr:SDR family NAD(P)-dependent oxidoreductase [Parvularcula sp.]